MPARNIRPAKIGLFSVLTVTLALAGCAVGPDYQRPEATLPATYSQAPTDESATAPVDPDWWTLFGDADLNALVQQALAANQDLQAAVARLEAADAFAREVGAAYYPAVGLDAATSRLGTSGVTYNGQQMGGATYNNRRAALTLSYEIDLWGRIRRQNEAAGADALSSRFARDSVRLALIGNVANEYLALRSHDAEIAVSQNTVDSREETVRIVRARLDAGNASGLELAQAENSLASAQSQLSQLKRLRGLSENQIGLLTGQPGLRIPAGDFAKLPLPPMPPTGLPSTLLEARPDVRQAEEKLIAANARIGVAKAAYFPTISLTGIYGSESMALSNLFTGPAGIWSAALGLTMPVFDAGRTGARVDQASAGQKEALANYRMTMQSAFKDVNDALVALRELRAEEAANIAQLEAAQRSLKLSQARYEAGYAGFLDVLDAQRTTNVAQLTYLNSRKNRLGAAVDLFKALGGGWREDI
jgi:multidrug efflux system outer membrane protein